MDKVKKPFYKKWWVWLIAFLVIGGILSEISGDDEVKGEPEKVETSAPVTEKKKEVKTDTTEKDYFVNEVSPQIALTSDLYDSNWVELWVPTFEGVANGTVDQFAAYENMKQLELNYKQLMDQIDDIDDKELSKGNKKLLKEFKKNFKDATMMRMVAAKDAKVMFDKGTFSPSEMDKVTESVEIADRTLIQAAVDRTTLNASFDVE